MILILLNDEVLDPEMVVVPPNVVVAEPALRVPLLTRLPSIRISLVGVKLPVTVTFLNWIAEPPLIEVAPLKIKVLEVNVEVELATKFPFRLTLKVEASNTPFDRVRLPFIIIS